MRQTPNLESKIFIKFKSGDQESFNLISKKLMNLKIGTKSSDTHLSQVVPQLMNLFLVMNEKLITKNNIDSPGALAKVILQQSSKNNFHYGQRGYPQTTTYIHSIIETIDIYFYELSKRPSKRAFNQFKKIVNSSFHFKQKLIEYNHTQDFENNPDLLKVLKYVNGLKYQDAIIRPGLGTFILKVNFFCGNKASKKDMQVFLKIKKNFERSETMTEFLKFFLV